MDYVILLILLRYQSSLFLTLQKYILNLYLTNFSCDFLNEAKKTWFMLFVHESFRIFAIMEMCLK